MSRSSKLAPRQQPYWLLSIDPAKAAGWALFEDGKLLRWGAADGSTWRTLNASLAEVAKLVTTFSNCVKKCCIEEAYPTWGKQSFRGTCTLGRRRGLAQAAAESAGFDDFSFVMPSEWQGPMGWRKGQDSKEWSLELCRSRYGIVGITHDVSDAILLGQHMLDSYLV